MIHQLYKKVGETPLMAIDRLRKEGVLTADELATYAGRLDPMAEGLLIVLSGDDRFKKEEWNGLAKTYRAVCLFGVGTDTGDLLGIPNIQEIMLPSREMVEEKIKSFVGTFVQSYHPFSSKPVDGKPLFAYALDGEEPSHIPNHEVTLISCALGEIQNTKLHEILPEILERINTAPEGFRNELIEDGWKKVEDKEIMLVELTLSVSSGFYVRVFVEDLAKQLGSSACLFSLIRESVGEYSIEKSDS